MEDMKNRDTITQTPQEPEVPMLNIDIGKTRYRVGIHFSKTSTETLQDKINKMIRRDIENGVFDCKE